MLIKKIIYIKAFVILELLIVVAAFTIILFATIPSMYGFIGKNRALSCSNELKGALQFARSSAVRFGEDVNFCASKDHKTCSGSWVEGQIVITAVTKKILRVFPQLFPGDSLVWHGSFGMQKVITFSPDGFLRGQQGSFCYYSAQTVKNAVAIILSPTGRIRISTDVENNCN